MTQIDYEIKIFYRKILHLFLALGTLPSKPPARGGKVTVAPIDSLDGDQTTGCVVAPLRKRVQRSDTSK